MSKEFFDQYPRAQSMRDYYLHAMNLRFELWESKGLEYWPIQDATIDISKEMSRAYASDVEDIWIEITDMLDATIWADLPGGVNNPFPDQPPNRFGRKFERIKEIEAGQLELPIEDQ